MELPGLRKAFSGQQLNMGLFPMEEGEEDSVLQLEVLQDAAGEESVQQEGVEQDRRYK